MADAKARPAASEAAVGALSYSSMLQEHDVARTQRELRKRLLQEIAAKEFNNGLEPNGVVAHVSQGPLVSTDIPVLGNVLLKVGDVQVLNLILHSPGGDGTVVEKLVKLCRAQCKTFRVLIPNEAKSAATLVALGADQIIMGAPSELGPIDAQVQVVANGVPQLISAQSFIDARDALLKTHKEQVKAGEDTSATLQMLATLDLPFIAECERLMAFGKDVAEKFLTDYMFKRKRDKDAKIKKVTDTLSSVKRFKVHGRRVDGSTARTELGLDVLLCGYSDPLWKKIWEYYTRADMALGRSDGAVKLIETEHELLTASMPLQL